MDTQNKLPLQEVEQKPKYHGINKFIGKWYYMLLVLAVVLLIGVLIMAMNKTNIEKSRDSAKKQKEINSVTWEKLDKKKIKVISGCNMVVSEIENEQIMLTNENIVIDNFLDQGKLEE